MIPRRSSPPPLPNDPMVNSAALLLRAKQARARVDRLYAEVYAVVHAAAHAEEAGTADTVPHVTHPAGT